MLDEGELLALGRAVYDEVRLLEEDDEFKQTITLDNYEVTNLRALIEACGYPYTMRHERCPLNVANTGDWLGQIYLKLRKVDLKPNASAEELVRSSLAWE